MAIQLHDWKTGDPIKASWLKEMSKAILAVLTGGKGIVVKASGQKIIIENVTDQIVPTGSLAGKTALFKLMAGPDASDLYTGYKQKATGFGTFTNLEAGGAEVSHTIKFIGLDGELPGAGSGERWENKVVRASREGVTGAGEGVFNLIADPT